MRRFAFLALLAIFLALPLIAAEPKADVYLGPSLHHAEQFDLGAALTVAPKAAPLLITINAGPMRIDGRHGFVTAQHHDDDFMWPHPAPLPYSVKSRTVGRVEVAIQFLLNGPR